MISSEETEVDRQPRSLALAHPLASGLCGKDEPEGDVIGSRSLSDLIGQAEGTRPRPIRIEIKTASRRLTIFAGATGASK